MNLEGEFGDVDAVGQEFLDAAGAVVLATDLGEVTVDVVEFGLAATGHVLIHRRIVQRVGDAADVIDILDSSLAGLVELESGAFAGVVSLVDQLGGHVFIAGGAKRTGPW